MSLLALFGRPLPGGEGLGWGFHASTAHPLPTLPLKGEGHAVPIVGAGRHLREG